MQTSHEQTVLLTARTGWNAGGVQPGTVSMLIALIVIGTMAFVWATRRWWKDDL